MLPHIEESSARFYQEHGALILTDFLTEKQKEILLQEATKHPIDGFLQSDLLKQTIIKMRLGSCMSQLTKKRHYQLGVCRLLQDPELEIFPEDYSIRPILSFFYLQLEGKAEEPFPVQTLDGMFIDPKRPVDIHQKGVGLLLGIATTSSQYILNEEDPHTNELKKHSYGFGDHLDQSKHPILK